MRKYQDFVTKTTAGGTLAAAGSISVTVNLAGTLTAASLFSDNGVTPLSNPVITTSLGYFFFFVADGLYDLVFTGSGITPFTQSNISIFAPISLKTNAVSNVVQNILNLTQGTGITLSDAGSGQVSIVNSSPDVPVSFKTNSVSNSVQNVLNLTQGTGITLADAGSGQVTITNSASTTPVLLQTNTVSNSSQSTLNLTNGTGITLSNVSGGQVSVTSTVTAPTFQTNGTPNATQTLLNLKNGSNVTITADGAGGATIASSTGVNNQNTPQRWIAAIGGTTTLTAIGLGVSQLGSTSAPLPHGDNDIFPTDFSAAATGSLNSVIGANGVVNGNGGIMPPKMINRWSLVWMPTVSTNVRFWCGLAQNLVLNNASMAADTPPNTQGGIAVIFAAFRYSATTDTTWKAICQLTNASQTVVDTGVAINTSTPSLFEIIPGTAASYTFYIDGTLVATISTTIPLASARLAGFWCADNKNTNNAATATHYAMYQTLKMLST